MARRPVSKELRVEVRNFEKATSLVSLGPEGFTTWEKLPGVPQHHGVSGSFVRIQPPDDATDEAVELVRRRLREAGAIAVRVLPRAKQGAAPVPEQVVEPRSSREVVLELVEEVQTRDQERLRRVSEEIMAEVGL